MSLEFDDNNYYLNISQVIKDDINKLLEENSENDQENIVSEIIENEEVIHLQFESDLIGNNYVLNNTLYEKYKSNFIHIICNQIGSRIFQKLIFNLGESQQKEFTNNVSQLY
jgi:hypothetical protein